MAEDSCVVLESPLTIINKLYDKNPSILHKLEEVGEHFRAALNGSLSQIPCINNVAIDKIKPNSLVRYRGMIQDMFDPEFYLGKYETVNKKKGEKRQRLGCYTDTHGLDDEEIDFSSNANVTLERHTFHCVPIPGENEWVKNLYSERTCISKNMITDKPSVRKRPLEDDQSDTTPMEEDKPCNGHAKPVLEKKLKADISSNEDMAARDVASQSQKSTNVTDFVNNFPLPGEKEPACFIKLPCRFQVTDAIEVKDFLHPVSPIVSSRMYANNGELKLNDVADFICILSVDPIFASSSMSDENPGDEMIAWPTHNVVEEKAHCPPPSLIPRLHCVFVNKMERINPQDRPGIPIYENVSKELSLIRSSLIQLLVQVFGGDSVMAEYFLFHLMSSVYGRCGTICLGKLTMNIMKCPSGKFTEDLYKLIEILVEKSHYLPLKLENLNNLNFVPRKDYDANRLASGLLQLPLGFHLILDETKMQSGKLNSDGVHNLTAIGNLMQWQKVEYDFKFQKIEMTTNVNVLVMSEGKSMLICDCQLPIVSEQLNDIQIDQLISGLAPKLLDKIRLYLGIVRSMEYNLTDEIQNALENDFVEMRKEDPKGMNADAFALLLTTARYMALSYGQSTLSSSLWIRTKELDAERRKRVS